MRHTANEIVDAIADLQDAFPDAIFAYWDRDEFDSQSVGEDGEATPLTDEQWGEVNANFADRVYVAVSNAEQIDYALAQDVTPTEKD